MKRRWTLIAVFAVIAVLAGVTLFLKNRPKPQTQTAANTTIELSRLDKEKISKIDIMRSDGELIVTKKGKDWALNYPYPVTLDTYNVDGFLSSFTDLNAESLIEENPSDLAQYGLKPPKATAQVILDDGTMKTFFLGDKTPTGSSYYFQVKGDPKVYTVWSSVGEHIRYTVTDLRDKTITPAINADEITYLKARVRDGTVIEIKEKTEAESKAMDLGMGKYIVTQPYAYPIGADAEKSDAFLRAPTGIQIVDFVDDAPNSLARYGLDKPWGEVTVRDKANTIGFQFGADLGSDKVYFKITGKPTVYTANTYELAFMDTKAFDLVDKFAYIPNIEDVDRVEIAAKGETHKLTLTRTVKKAEQAGEQDETVTAYAADGKTVEEKAFKDFYQAVIGLIVEGEAPRLRNGTPFLTTRYFLNKGNVRQVLVSYVPYNADFYGVIINGKGQFAISKTQINSFLSTMDKFLKGEKIEG